MCSFASRRITIELSISVDVRRCSLSQFFRLRQENYVCLVSQLSSTCLSLWSTSVCDDNDDDERM